MADQQQLERLRAGVGAWNTWRQHHPQDSIDLSDADLNNVDLNNANLRRANLSDADLSHAHLRRAHLRRAHLRRAHLYGASLNHADLSTADLSHADLSSAHLSDADLSHAELSHADLRRAHLSDANLYGASLNHVDLSHADLSSADLRGAYLRSANLSSANLSSANLHEVQFDATLFAWVDLSSVKGLGTAVHMGPSSVDMKSVTFPSDEHIRQHFLRGAGFSDTFIEYPPSLLTTAIQYASCFISYAHQDETLARRLYKDLQDKGVRCWFAPHDLRPGTLFHRGIEDAIQVHETVLLLLSEHAVASNWVAHEVETTLNRQAREQRDLLFPLRLDEAILLAKDDWAARLRDSRHIGDFTNWHDDAIYRHHFAELLRHLKVKTT